MMRESLYAQETAKKKNLFCPPNMGPYCIHILCISLPKNFSFLLSLPTFLFYSSVGFFLEKMDAPSNYALTKNETIADILSCEICFERFSESLDKAPKALSCLHTFCASCLKGVVNNCSISCPTYRKVTQLGADGLITNGSSAVYRLQWG